VPVVIEHALCLLPGNAQRSPSARRRLAILAIADNAVQDGTGSVRDLPERAVLLRACLLETKRMSLDPGTFRQAVRLVALLNLGYFGIEFAVALRIGSVSLLADSVDFLEDASVSFLILLALGWSSRARARLGMALAAILLVPALAALWTAWQKLALPIPPEPLPMSATGLGALAVNFFCALVLARFRHHEGSLSRAAFLSARNDVLANIAIIAAAVVTAALPSVWPDLIVGIGIAALNADAARAVFRAAHAEHAQARP
jgi:Co/Zn/Cd efflux system component